MRQGRRDEMNSLPHVLWMLAKRSPRRSGSFVLPPRTAASVMPASRAEDGTASRHGTCSDGGSRPLCPQGHLHHIVPLALVPHTRHERCRWPCPYRFPFFRFGLVR